VQIGLIASERQAINACLRSLAAEDERFQPLAGRCWSGAMTLLHDRRYNMGIKNGRLRSPQWSTMG
jgi:hypothetical protein